jgi:hypothetical protein
MAVNGKQNLVEQVYRFVVRASQSHWDSNDHFNDLEAVNLLKTFADQLTAREYQSLMLGWSQIRNDEGDATMRDALDAITERLQNGYATN